MLEAPPEPLDENIVDCAAPAVHADTDFMTFQAIGVNVRGELAALVGIDYLVCSV